MVASPRFDFLVFVSPRFGPTRPVSPYRPASGRGRFYPTSYPVVRPDHLDPDRLDERVRVMPNMGREDEVVVFDRRR